MSAKPFAVGTSVPVDRTLGQLRMQLSNAGASHYAFGESPEAGFVQFALDGLHYRFEVRRPTAEEAAAARARAPKSIRMDGAIDAEWRRRWRARVLWLKATIEFAEGQPGSLANVLLGNLVLPDGQTMAGWAVPQIEAMYAGGAMPPLLGPGKETP